MICEAVVFGERRAIESAGSVSPHDDFCLWAWVGEMRPALKPRIVYPASQGHMEMVGDRVVTEEAQLVSVPRGQVIICSGWRACIEWLAANALEGTIVSPVLEELVLLQRAKDGAASLLAA